jgi:hypothetical protein
MTDTADPRPIADGVFSDMSIPDLELAEMTCQVQAGRAANEALLEALKGATWYQGAAFASAAATGLCLSIWLADWTRITVAGVLIVGAAIGLAGGAWHRRRAKDALVGGEIAADFQDRVRRELRRRGRP